MRILVEASGCLTSQYLITAIQQAGHQAVASDITCDTAAYYLADDFIQMPKVSDPELWQKTERLLSQYNVDAVIPTLDDSLLGWAERIDYFKTRNVHIMLSEAKSVAICTDKWLTYNHFVRHHLPMPATSLKQVYPLIKPRHGRGSSGVRIESQPIEMTGLISQQVLTGKEYTVDVLVCPHGKPISIVPRYRAAVRDGKSVMGVVQTSDAISHIIYQICQSFKFKGAINIQLFDDPDAGLKVVEINPRLAGGSALAFAATTNWVTAMIDIFIENHTPIIPAVKNGMKMYRYYAEHFVS